MKFPLSLLLLLNACALLAGCASAPASADNVDSSAARAARVRYWALQAAQKPVPEDSRFERLPIRRPERIEDGIILNPGTDYLRVPRMP